MRRTAIFLMAVVFAALVSSAVYAGTKITMKNGRTFVVGDCQDTKRSLVCEMPGGTIELDKSDIESIKGVKYTPDGYDKGEHSEESATAEETPGTASQKKHDNGVQKDETSLKQGRVVKGLSQEQLQRLNQINEKKSALKAEREKIAQERDRLNEEIKKAGVIRKQEDIDAFRRRVAESEAKIKEFNEQVRRLNDEEDRLFEESSKLK